MSDAVHEEFLRETLELARDAKKQGERPFAALLAVDGQTVGTAHNTADSEQNPLAHAELNLLEDAIEHLDPETISAGTLYASAEPCPMCIAAAYYAGVRSIVYSVPNSRLVSLVGSGIRVPCRDIAAKVSADIEVIGPLLEDMGTEIIRASEYAVVE